MCFRTRVWYNVCVICFLLLLESSAAFFFCRKMWVKQESILVYTFRWKNSFSESTIQFNSIQFITCMTSFDFGTCASDPIALKAVKKASNCSLHSFRSVAMLNAAWVMMMDSFLLENCSGIYSAFPDRWSARMSSRKRWTRMWDSRQPKHNVSLFLSLDMSTITW